MTTCYERTSAVLSPDGVYRYSLSRTFDRDAGRTMAVMGLNPSTADAEQDDATIRRCVGFARREQCSALVMLNLFAFRATDPRALSQCADPIGPDTDTVLRVFAKEPDVLMVAAWGAHPLAQRRVRAVVPMFAEWWCFGTTANGSPRHPLYLPNNAALVRFTSPPPQRGDA